MKMPKKQCKSKFMNDVLDNIFHPNNPICRIIPTSTKTKVDCFTLYRPKPDQTCLDYNISQTDTKMDAGDTKIHYQETIAEYIPALTALPPSKKEKRKKRRCFSGGPPQWEFSDEIWRWRQEELQKVYQENFKLRVALRKKGEKSAILRGHLQVVAKVGPEWYQELSPKQIQTVDNLKNCIVKDLSEGTIINTQENIADLGLVLRPNHGHVKKALRNCCKCPVEFLLALYQLIKPKRTRYSINDRLLLSSVVHLTMQPTLKELHIRIPSPPSSPKLTKKRTKKKNFVKYDSPYLEPYTFKRSPPKFKGTYKNKHLQFPQSPYFCYLKELDEMKKAKEVAGVPEVVDEKIDEELKVAQQMYEELVDFRPVPILLRPSRYNSGDNFCSRQGFTLEVDKTEIEIATNIGDEQTCRDAETEVCNVERLRGGGQNSCSCCKKKPKNPKFSKQNDASEQPAETQKTEEHENLKASDKLAKRKRSSVSTSKPEEKKAVSITSDKTYEDGVFKVKSGEGVDYAWAQCGTIRDPSFESCAADKGSCKHQHDIEIYNKMFHLIRPSGGKEKEKCGCKAKYQEFVKKPLCQCEKCLEDRRKRNSNFVISGLKETDYPNTVRIVDRISVQKPCTCLKDHTKVLDQSEKERNEFAKRPCDCRKQATKLAQTPTCPCEKCEEDRRRQAAKFIIAGVKETNEENERIIEGISTGKPCECWRQYEKRADKYETFKKGQKAVVEMKQKDYKFAIGGIVNSSQGPVYEITGMRPPIDCSCAKKARQEEAERRIQNAMPQEPRGRIPREILGVKETGRQRVYILGSTLPIEDCDCMTIYKKFQQEHSTCLELYQQYLSKMRDEYNEFMKEMLPPSSSRRSSRVTNVQSENLADSQEKNQDDSAPEEEQKPPEPKTKKPPSCISCKKVKSNKSTRSYHPVYCTCGSPYYCICCDCGKIQESKCTECTCGGEIIECVDCTCGEEEVGQLQPEIEEEENELKRFFIFKKISCNRKWQRRIIKKALESMAEDGFPLAKLPQSYKLPHFKLWMQMRCGKFWTQEDRYEYILKSKNMWIHCDRCNLRRNRIPSLGITKAEGHALDWSKSDYCRKLVKNTLEKYYRTIKQDTVNFGREFFPTTFSYEFPFKTWRDCYFAYTPTKEENALARFIWRKNEYKNYADMQRFCF